ncbi:hypothetical protein UY3_16928 [Chelonia mydas]|uniref:Uncharacterized protein n=1 Tax=Chelonia mydas TaxID=8469 RepID=M7BCI2_CHEMY|nr:hypothetical protein UY3_16928 [Chelonia mydas]
MNGTNDTMGEGDVGKIAHTVSHRKPQTYRFGLKEAEAAIDAGDTWRLARPTRAYWGSLGNLLPGPDWCCVRVRNAAELQDRFRSGLRMLHWGSEGTCCISEMRPQTTRQATTRSALSKSLSTSLKVLLKSEENNLIVAIVPSQKTIDKEL